VLSRGSLANLVETYTIAGFGNALSFLGLATCISAYIHLILTLFHVDSSLRERKIRWIFGFIVLGSDWRWLGYLSVLRETASTGGPYAFIGFQQSKEAQGAVQSSIYRD